MLTPGIYNSAYFEHTFLARQMGVELVEGRDLVVDDGASTCGTTRGPQRVDVIYRRVDDDFLDPLTFRPDSRLGVAGLINAYRAGQIGLANAHRHRRRRRQGHLPLRARHDPVLPAARTRSWPTSRPSGRSIPAHRQHILANLDKLVVKAVDGSGGYGMLIGPASTAEQRDGVRPQDRGQPPRLHRPADDHV